MDEKLFNKALDAFNEYMAAHDAHIFNQPTREFSSTDKKYVYLGNGIDYSLGKYVIASGAFIPDK